MYFVFFCFTFFFLFALFWLLGLCYMRLCGFLPTQQGLVLQAIVSL